MVQICDPNSGQQPAGVIIAHEGEGEGETSVTEDTFIGFNMSSFSKDANVSRIVNLVKLNLCPNAQLVILFRRSVKKLHEPLQLFNSVERTCAQCSTGAIEDEAHFVLQCPRHVLLRNQLFACIKDDDFLNYQDLDKLKFLLNNPDIAKPTAQFIVKAFNNRTID